MNRKKAISLVVIFFVYSVIINTFYRPYIYTNKIQDYGFADIGNNIFFIPATYLIYNLITKRYLISKYYDILFSFVFYSFIEVLSFFFPFFGTFDYKDIFGLFLGALTLYLFVANEK